MKSHSKAITKISINPSETILVSGSEDKTIFIHRIFNEIEEEYTKIVPIGLVDINSICSTITWIPYGLARVLIGTTTGDIIEADLPERPRSYTDVSYNLSHVILRSMTINSVKSELLREIELQEIQKRKDAKVERKRLELAKLRADKPELNVDENEFLQDSESTEELEPLYYPKIPNKILWLLYTDNDTMIVSMADYDSGYLYEYKFDADNPIKSITVPEINNNEIHCYLIQ